MIESAGQSSQAAAAVGASLYLRAVERPVRGKGGGRAVEGHGKAVNRQRQIKERWGCVRVDRADRARVGWVGDPEDARG